MKDELVDIVMNIHQFNQDLTTLNIKQAETIKEQKQEIERLNNIINEFDKWLLGEQMMFYRGSDNERLIKFGETKNKWLELKGSDK